MSQLVKGFDMISSMSKQMSNMGSMQKLSAMRGMADPAMAGGRGLGMGRKGSTKDKRKQFGKRRRR